MPEAEEGDLVAMAGKMTNEDLIAQLEREAVAFDYTAEKNEIAMVLGRDARSLAALLRLAAHRLHPKGALHD